MTTEELRVEYMPLSSDDGIKVNLKRRRRFVYPGQLIGMLYVIGETGHKGKLRMATVECRCGVRKDMSIKLLSDPKTKSCGCMRRRLILSSGQLIEEFWTKVGCPNENTQCWEWTGYRNYQGYGLWSSNRRQFVASRFMWELFNKPIASGLQVLHRCDNPPCVRPDHLFLGTIGDNMRDRTRKGRQAKGDANGGGRKLVAAQVYEIRRLIKEKVSRRDIANQFNISSTMIGYIEHRRQWNHLP